MRLTTLLFTLIALNCFSGTELKRVGPDFVRVKEEINTNLIGNQAIFKFNIQNVNQNVKTAKIQYSIDGKTSTVQLRNFSFEVPTLKGKHKFLIYINDDYLELYSDSLEINSQCVDTYNLYPKVKMHGIEVIVDKPVIYLYPEVETEVQVVVDPVGTMNFTYPEYDGGWNVTVQPNGTIDHKGSSYNYLFWEAKQTIDQKSVGSNGGFMVEKVDLLTFIENKLDTAGFTSKEKADFITYWIPRMLAFDVLFVEFIQGDQCNQFAELSIVPEPDNVNRFYMSWGEYDPSMNLIPQTITKMDRNGFDVLEWGGQELPASMNRVLTN